MYLLKKLIPKSFKKIAKSFLQPDLVNNENCNKPVSNINQDKYLDKTEFKYILWLDRVYQKINNVPGHIVELGVANGRNSIIFSHLITMNGDDDVRKYFGFDTFNGYTEEDLALDPHLDKSNWENGSKMYVENRLKSLGFSRLTKLYEGDISVKTPQFVSENPNFRAALLYVDCNAYHAAMSGMEAFINNMSPGGIICIDEKMQGGETRALIEFCEKHGLKYQKDASPFGVPAYTVV